MASLWSEENKACYFPLMRSFLCLNASQHAFVFWTCFNLSSLYMFLYVTSLVTRPSLCWGHWSRHQNGQFSLIWGGNPKFTRNLNSNLLLFYDSSGFTKYFWIFKLLYFWFAPQEILLFHWLAMDLASLNFYKLLWI